MDVQHRPQCGCGCHGAGSPVLPDPSGPDLQEAMQLSNGYVIPLFRINAVLLMESYYVHRQHDMSYHTLLLVTSISYCFIVCEPGKEGCEEDQETAMMKVERTVPLTETNV